MLKISQIYQITVLGQLPRRVQGHVSLSCDASYEHFLRTVRQPPISSRLLRRVNSTYEASWAFVIQAPGQLPVKNFIHYIIYINLFLTISITVSGQLPEKYKLLITYTNSWYYKCSCSRSITRNIEGQLPYLKVLSPIALAFFQTFETLKPKCC